MLIEQVDRFDAQAAQRVLGDLTYAGGLAVEAVRSRLEVVAKLGGDGDIAPEGLKRLADQLFIREGAIDLRGIEEGYAPLDRRAHKLNHCRPVRSWAAMVI